MTTKYSSAGHKKKKKQRYKQTNKKDKTKQGKNITTSTTV